MSSLCLIAASLVANGQAPGWQLNLSNSPPVKLSASNQDAIQDVCAPAPTVTATVTEAERYHPEFSGWGQLVVDRSRSASLPAPGRVRPINGKQLYAQRLAALKAGKIYTRLPSDSFYDQWRDAAYQPTYQDWLNLMGQEARAIEDGQGSSKLTVLLGDSLSLWFPRERLSNDRFWLNQGISGDTTRGVLRRLSLFDYTHPDRIYVMAGINDLRHGASDQQVLSNLQQIMRQLRLRHPQSEIVVHSILPTRMPALPAQRIRSLNRNIALLAEQENVRFLDLQNDFADGQGNLRRDLTTDGLHLSLRGYDVWRQVLALVL